MARALPDLLLLRHGETLWNREGRMQGERDSGLTDLGRAQSAAAGLLLQALGVGPGTHVARTSPQGRAQETARVALGPLGLHAVPEPRLSEIAVGRWTGLTFAEIAAGWPGPPGEGVLAGYARCPGGEALAEVASRAEAVLASLDGPAVLVSHGVTLRVLSSVALGLPLAAAEDLACPQGWVVRLRDGRWDPLGPAELGPRGLPGDGRGDSPAATGG